MCTGVCTGVCERAPVSVFACCVSLFVGLCVRACLCERAPVSVFACVFE